AGLQSRFGAEASLRVRKRQRTAALQNLAAIWRAGLKFRVSVLECGSPLPLFPLVRWASSFKNRGDQSLLTSAATNVESLARRAICGGPGKRWRTKVNQATASARTAPPTIQTACSLGG